MEHTKKPRMSEAINAPGPSNTTGTEDDVNSPDDFSDPENETNLSEFRTLSSSAEISDEELVSLNRKDLNRLLKNSSLSLAEIQCLKDRRRTLKRRGYSASSRNKIVEETDQLQTEKDVVLGDINTLKMRNETLEQEILQIKENYELLKQYAESQNICIPQELDDK